ncbi:hypothetical protein Nepgr_018685 [Nepenthes gracilis]|uniref:Uncharacterized protein n=1 Tax=Nepenthes gracilis TaxID=150966 RepID=A0AAD3XU94_NEPGR|nr:hypothetical protein Nepgr_018685 [Nepenthes gracilis]
MNIPEPKILATGIGASDGHTKIWAAPWSTEAHNGMPDGQLKNGPTGREGPKLERPKTVSAIIGRKWTPSRLTAKLGRINSALPEIIITTGQK